MFQGLIGGFLCNFSKENGLIPINKNLFSLSYAFIAGSSAFLFFIVLFLIIEHWRLWSGSPFCEIGKELFLLFKNKEDIYFVCTLTGQNSIMLYLGHNIFYNTLPWRWQPVNETSHTEYLIMDCWATIFWCAIALVMYKKNIFIVVQVTSIKYLFDIFFKIIIYNDLMMPRTQLFLLFSDK